MQFSDTSTKLGLYQQTQFLCDTDSTGYQINDFTRECNAAYEEVVGWLINADGVWQFDDENYSTLNEGTTTLVSGQSDYSFAATFLDIEWVKIKDKNGLWHILDPIDQSQTSVSLEDYLQTNGFPEVYDKTGDTIRLYPAPDNGLSVTLSGGMKVGFKRTASLFTASDTTKVPGFASPYHILLSYMASIPYCVKYKKDRVAPFLTKIAQLKADLIMHYSNREKDTRKVATMKPISFR
jgi:hypothetical protein